MKSWSGSDQSRYPPCFNLYLIFSAYAILLVAAIDPPTTVHQLRARQAITRPNPLRNFEVKEPPPVPKTQPCERVLLEHTFANSYGHPAQVNYFPPPDECGGPAGSWASVVFNLTTTSIGVQYDRLGMIYLNDVEIWRTSTAEPTKSGIVWTVLRDMSRYKPLLAKPNGKLVFDLGNIVDQKLNLTGNFEVTLSAKFYPANTNQVTNQYQIGNIGNTVGNNLTKHIKFPKNLATALVEIYASGGSEEEFWYTNVPDQYVKTLDPDGKAGVIGKGPFREVQLWIDNHLAGVVYPFPVIYTGGILLSWWRPMAAIGAFDPPTYFVDITPFVPLLSDAQAHNFTIVVEGQGQDRSINSNWIFSGSIYATLDPSGAQTTGQINDYQQQSDISSQPPSASPVQMKNKKDKVNFEVTSYRKIKISSTVVTGSSGARLVTFEQDLQYKNEQSWIIGGEFSNVIQYSSGKTTSTHGGTRILLDEFSYPFNLTSSTVQAPKTNTSKTQGNLEHGLSRTNQIPFPIEKSIKRDIKTTQKSEGSLELNNKGRAIRGLGRTSQSYQYKDSLGETYSRDIEVFNSTHIIRDNESGSLAPVGPKWSLISGPSEDDQDLGDIFGMPCRLNNFLLPDEDFYSSLSNPQQFVYQSPNQAITQIIPN